MPRSSADSEMATNLPEGPRRRGPSTVRRRLRQAAVRLDGRLHLACGDTRRRAQRRGEEALLRYVLRPPLAQGRVALKQDGLVRLSLKRAFAEGTVAVDMDPLLLCGLATSVPPPRFQTNARRATCARGTPMRPFSRSAPRAGPLFRPMNEASRRARSRHFGSLRHTSSRKRSGFLYLRAIAGRRQAAIASPPGQPLLHRGAQGPDRPGRRAQAPSSVSRTISFYHQRNSPPKKSIDA